MHNQLDSSSSSSIDIQVEKLESSVNRLLLLCEKLSEQNKSFEISNNQLRQERAELQVKNDKVKSQVEAMVDRLKALDQAS